MGKLGTCRSCDYGPLARGAVVCPNCGKTNPNPSFVTKWLSRILLAALFVFVVVVIFSLAVQNGG